MEVSGGVVLTGESWPAIRLFLSDPHEWLPLPATPAGPDRWLITVRGGPALHTVLAEVGPFEDDGDIRTRSLRWAPRSGSFRGRYRHRYLSGSEDAVGRLLPRFAGRIDIQVVGDTSLLLTLTGVYEVPGGWAGAAVDRAVLHRLAEGTVHAFLASVAERLRSATPGLALVGD